MPRKLLFFLLSLPWIAAVLLLVALCTRGFLKGLHFGPGIEEMYGVVDLFIGGIGVLSASAVGCLTSLFAHRRIKPDRGLLRVIGISMASVPLFFVVGFFVFPRAFDIGRDLAYRNLDLEALHRASLELREHAMSTGKDYRWEEYEPEAAPHPLPEVIECLFPNSVWVSTDFAIIHLQGGGIFPHHGIGIVFVPEGSYSPPYRGITRISDSLPIYSYALNDHCMFPHGLRGTLSARVIRSVALEYTDGADPAEDRPAIVRAGSAVDWAGERLVVVQDDACILALTTPTGDEVEAFLLPGGENGERTYSSQRGNKARKLDLEACLMHEGRLYAFGSGSTSARERVVVVEGLGGDPASRKTNIVEASAFYAALRAEREFSGSEMNIEGTVLRGDRVWFFQRGNGAPKDGLEPVDASCEVSLDELLRYLEDPENSPPPAVESIRRYELGELDGVRLTFTDAAALGERIVYLAVAEDSPDTYRDGPVTGVVVGVIDPANEGELPRWTRLLDADGKPYLGKAEGIVLHPKNPSRAFVVVDRDDPELPAELCLVELEEYPGAGL